MRDIEELRSEVRELKEEMIVLRNIVDAVTKKNGELVTERDLQKIKKRITQGT